MDRTKKLSDRELVWEALYEAALWQDSLADAYAERDDPYRAAALAQAAAYRALMVKRYGTERTMLDRMIANSPLVDIRTIGKT